MMAASGPGASYSAHNTTSIIDVLLAYGTRGGALYATYRHPDNPLLLTDIRWQGPNGEVVEAHRSPDDMAMVREEREAWAQVALRSTTLRPDTVGPQAPWLQVPLDPRDAHELATRARRAREASVPPSQHSFGSIVPSYGEPTRLTPFSPGTPPGFALPYTPGHPAPSPQSPRDSLGDGGRSFESFGGSSSVFSSSESSQITGAWPRETFHSPSSPPNSEVVVVACVEIEMPSIVTDPSQDFTRDFARDVALNFNLAARSAPQTRETRGWMHGSRMILGALMVLGLGSRPASRAEMEHAADTLATALANRTLPYVRLRFAEMGEWAQGVPLPE